MLTFLLILIACTWTVIATVVVAMCTLAARADRVAEGRAPRPAFAPPVAPTALG